MLASDYAKALYSAVEKNPSDTRGYLRRLREGLIKRKHEKLLPRILAEYQKLELRNQRIAQSRRITPEAERTRILLSLYKKLIHG